MAKPRQAKTGSLARRARHKESRKAYKALEKSFEIGSWCYLGTTEDYIAELIGRLRDRGFEIRRIEKKT